MKMLLLICLVVIPVSTQGNNLCPKDIPISIAVCRHTGKKVGETGTWNPEKECSRYSDCCWDAENKACLRMPNPNGGKKPADPNFTIPSFTKSNKRSFRFEFPGCEIPLNFPDNCKPHKDSLFVMEPPMNIPYCVRTPCSLNEDKQKKLDQNHFLCGSEPGCYFDRELYEYRDGYGEGHLPGVPVCHLAIRSNLFREKAQDVIDTYGFWNPYFTECLLDTFDKEFEAGPEGCKSLPLLEIFHVAPKLAGWEDITPSGCAYIGACWIKRRGCFYPLNLQELIVKSGQNNNFHSLDIPFGRPKCQYFNPSTPYSVLMSYGQCLSAGCTLDFSYTIKYYDYLFDLGETMNAEDHWKYWEQVLIGMVGPHNMDELPWKFDRSVGFNAPSPKLPKMPSAKEMEAKGVTRNFFLPPLPGSGKKSPPCGYPFKDYGFRPCAPPEFPELHYKRLCPYRPFHPPRFPPLKGSLKDCCKINPCYIPRRDIRNAYSGPTFYYTEWTPYSECSKNDRYLERTRKCISVRPELCKESTRQRKRCERRPEWGGWEAWTSCTFNICEKRTRVRYCLPEGKSCDRKKKEEQTELCYPQMRNFC